jgi:hypothetical protein
LPNELYSIEHALKALAACFLGKRAEKWRPWSLAPGLGLKEEETKILGKLVFFFQCFRNSVARGSADEEEALRILLTETMPEYGRSKLHGRVQTCLHATTLVKKKHLL